MIRDYSGMLWVALNARQIAEIWALPNSGSVVADITSTYIELAYVGRESGRFVVEFLKQLCEIVADADGEVECDSENEQGDRWFEYYWLENSRVVMQRATIVRGEVLYLN